jgi:hypothetical protein
VSRFAIAVTLSIGAILCAPQAQSGDVPVVTVALQFEHGYSAASLKEMKREFERILIPARVRVAWRIAGELTGRESFQEIVVARFKGHCEADQTGAASAPLPHLGRTHAISGDISPFAELDCDSIHASLARYAAPETVFQLQRMLGSGMARVLAHEFYHAVLRTPEHSTHGIAKASLTPADLFGGPIGFAPDQMERIVEALTPPADNDSPSAVVAYYSKSTVTVSTLPVNANGLR